MRRVLPVVVVLSALAAPVAAQQVQQQANTIAFPSFTVDQNWGRATMLMHAANLAGIAYAKAHGESVEAYGRAVGAQFAPGWGARDGGSAIRLARGLQNNLRAFAGTTIEMLAVSDTLVVMRANRSWKGLFGPSRTMLGVSLDEYETYIGAMSGEIARYAGLRYAQRVDSAYLTMTIAGRGRNAVVDFPFGTYSLSVPAQDAASNPDVAGDWQLTFTPDHKLTAAKDGEVVAEGTFDLSFDEMLWHNEQCPGPGRYRWTASARADTVRLFRLSDDCDARILVLANRALVKR